MPDRFDAIARNFYWLNVVRFFAGCFSKGELLDLADRVKSLIEDPIIGQSRHSVTIAAMLLADWVFAQSPKAVLQLSQALMKPESMQRLGPASRRYGSTSVISLPEKSGGRAIFEYAFGSLESTDLLSDKRRQLARIAAAQAPDDFVEKRWLDSPSSKSNPVRWLQVGRSLGALVRADRAEIQSRLGKVSLSRQMVAILASALRFDCILTSDQNVQILQNLYLSSSVELGRPDMGHAPYYLVPVICTCARILATCGS